MNKVMKLLLAIILTFALKLQAQTPEPIQPGSCASKLVPSGDVTTYFDVTPGKTYRVTAAGLSFVGDGTQADAKFTERYSSGNWTDIPDCCGYAGASFLDLQLNGVSPDWGMFSPGHVYNVLVTADTNVFGFKVLDSGYRENTGNLFVTVCRVFDGGTELKQGIANSCPEYPVSCESSCISNTLYAFLDNKTIDPNWYDDFRNECFTDKLNLVVDHAFAEGFTAGQLSIDVEAIRSQAFQDGVSSVPTCSNQPLTLEQVFAVLISNCPCTSKKARGQNVVCYVKAIKDLFYAERVSERLAKALMREIDSLDMCRGDRNP